MYFQVNLGSQGFQRFGEQAFFCFHVVFFTKPVPICLSCLEECCSSVLLWSSRYHLWKIKTPPNFPSAWWVHNDYIFSHGWTYPLKKITHISPPGNSCLKDLGHQTFLLQFILLITADPSSFFWSGTFTKFFSWMYTLSSFLCGRDQTHRSPGPQSTRAQHKTHN